VFTTSSPTALKLHGYMIPKASSILTYSQGMVHFLPVHTVLSNWRRRN